MNAISRNFLRVALVFCLSCGICAAQSTVDWPVYNGGLDGDHYSRLAQIDRANVHRLKVAWSFNTGEVGVLETNPLVVGRLLYAFTQSESVIALDAATGQLKWKFDPGFQGTQPSRGLTYWTDGKQGRIFAGIMDFLYCLDAIPAIPSLLWRGRAHRPAQGSARRLEPQSIALTIPGVIYKDLIIVGGRNPECHPAPPGDIRAYDVRTGKLRWSFHTIPHPGEPGYDTWPGTPGRRPGAANNWAGMALDVERGIVYAPTGSAVFDFYGGDRVGNDLYADTLLALDATRASACGIFRACTTTFGTAIFPRRPRCLP